MKQTTQQRPLFIPVYTEYYELFESGAKDTEYRKYGPRWNERTCVVGRDVVVSCGYGKQRRLYGKVVGFKRIMRYNQDTAAIRIEFP